jgi:hypothetical protein
MDKITKYRKILTEVLESYAGIRQGEQGLPGSLSIQLLFDRERDQYQVLGLGWKGEQQTFLVLLHFAIQNGKIWLHRHVADYDILADLEAKGIPKEDIVPAFHAPAIRAFTGYAVA